MVVIPRTTFIFFSWLFLCLNCLIGQTASDSIYVEDVILLGHKKTRPSVIFREMPFGRTDFIAIAELDKKVKEAHANLMNTGLFAEVDITYTNWEMPGNRVTFTVTIRETWYIYPVPVFELADRNFNVWWTEQNRDLDRVNVGLKFTHYNITGRRDKFKIGYQYGYTREYEGSYDLPYLNRAQNLGLTLRYSYLRRREQNYQTINNRQEFYEDPNQFIYRRTLAEAGLTYRKRLYSRHTIRLGYQHEFIADTIVSTLNPLFFANGTGLQRYFSLSYDFTSDKRDVRNYPWKGSYISARLQKEGLGIFSERNSFTLWGDYRRFTPLGVNWALNTTLGFKYSLVRQQQPFLENRAIGFGSYNLAGYQFYVVDGLDMVLARIGLRRKLAKGNIDLGKLVFIKAFRYIPYRILLGAQLDQGWANAPFDGNRNELANTWLIGGSAGVDLVLFYDLVISARYAYNKLGEGSFLIGTSVNF